MIYERPASAVTFTGNLGSTVKLSGSTGQHFNCGCMSLFTNDCTIALLIRRTASARFVTSLLMSSANYATSFDLSLGMLLSFRLNV